MIEWKHEQFQVQIILERENSIWLQNLYYAKQKNIEKLAVSINQNIK